MLSNNYPIIDTTNQLSKSNTSQTASWHMDPDINSYLYLIPLSSSQGIANANFIVGFSLSDVTINQIQLVIRGKVDITNPANSLQLQLQKNGTIYRGDWQNFYGTSYNYFYGIWTTNPETGLPFTTDDLKSFIYGFEVALGGGVEFRVPEFYVQVDYTPKTSVAPLPTINSIDKSKISDEIGMNESTVNFVFDIDVQAWEVRVLGTGQGTGLLADFGGSAIAGVELTALVDWTELYQEGDNRVNIYGQSLDGVWTPYHP